MADQPGFFDADARLRSLSAAGDPLGAAVDFELFRAALERARRPQPRRTSALRCRADVPRSGAANAIRCRMTRPSISCDRLSFMRFAGLALHDAVPDAKTIWLFREQLPRASALARLFADFDRRLHERGYLAMDRQIVDAPSKQTSNNGRSRISCRLP